jgi:acetyl-CoA acetyltransferase
MLSKAYIPYKGYYSTPFARWQGAMANEHAVVLGANTSKRWFAEKGWDPKMFDYVFLGMTVGQPQWFYGAPWAAALMGAEETPGVTMSHACATSTVCVYQAGMCIETGLHDNVYILTADRCSNGPHTVWPNPNGPGGEVTHENWNMDNFNRDPWAGQAMIRTAENVAREAGITREECDAATLRKYEQYRESLDDDGAFQKRYMFPAEVRVSKKKTVLVEEDEGVTPTTAEGLARLKPVVPDGVISSGCQTHPADGNAGLVVTTREKSAELSADAGIEIQLISYGFARAKKAFMPAAVTGAVRMALENARIKIDDVKAVKTHNPFIVNDLNLAKQMGIDVDRINNYGSSLIFGHPQGPTGARLVIEGIEEVAMAGGGYLLFGGCSAGDSAASLVLKIG